MRPPRFGPKPLRTDVQRFRRTTRLLNHVPKLANTVAGNEKQKIEQVANIVLQRIPIDWKIGVDKLRLFKRSAEAAAEKKKSIGCLHCTERCHLAIAMLNSSKVPAWLGREVFYNTDRKKWEVHDYVETIIKGDIHTLVFHSLQNVLDSYAIFDGPFEQIPPLREHKKYHPAYFRGIDSQQIGGVSHWQQFEKFTKRLSDSPQKEIERNRRRIELMVKEGIIPDEVEWQIQR